MLLSKLEAKRATSFELQRVSSGEKIRLADLQGKVVVLTFLGDVVRSMFKGMASLATDSA